MLRPRRLEALPLDKVSLDAKERRFIARVLDGPKSLDQIYRESPLFRHSVLNLLIALEQLGLLFVEDWDEESKTQQRQTQRLVQLKTKLDGPDAFNHIDAHWTDDGEAIDEAYAKVAAEIEELREIFPVESHERDVLDSLSQRAEDAYELLGDPTRRRSHRRETHSKFEIRSAIDLYEKQLEQFKIQKNVPEIIDRCRRLVELDPKNAGARTLLEKLRDAEETEERSGE